jgi:hypothetical protein
MDGCLVFDPASPNWLARLQGYPPEPTAFQVGFGWKGVGTLKQFPSLAPWAGGQVNSIKVLGIDRTSGQRFLCSQQNASPCLGVWPFRGIGMTFDKAPKEEIPNPRV